MPILIAAISLFSFGNNVIAQEAPTGNQHRIEIFADKLIEGEDYLAYRMMLHEVTDQNGNTTDITSRYSIEAIIPGPTIIMDEGDVAISQGGNSSNTTLSSIQKKYVLYVLNDIYVGTEIDSQTGEQTPVWVNPTLTAQ